MKLSEMTMEHLAQWCHVEAADVRLATAWDAAVAAVLGITGLNLEEADKRADLIFPAIAFTSDMIYNPGAQISGGAVNKVAESFISLHDHNLLPGGPVT